MSLTDIMEVGRQKRAAQEAEAQRVSRARRQERAELLADQRTRADALLSYSSLRSLSAALIPSIVLTIITVSVGVPVLFGFATSGSVPAWVLLPLGVLVKLWAVAVLMVVRARRKDIAFRKARSYRVTGYERSLDYSRSYPSTGFEIRFAGAVPPAAVLRDVFASLDEETTLESIEGQVANCEVSGEGSKFDGHRAWMPRWFYPAAEEVFDAIDAEYPIAEIRFPGY